MKSETNYRSRQLVMKLFLARKMSILQRQRLGSYNDN